MKYFRNLLSVLILVVLATSARAQTAISDTDNQLHSDLSLQYLVHLPKSSNDHPPVIILLHGMGSNEEDLYSLRRALPSDYAVVSARAPYVLGEGSYDGLKTPRSMAALTEIRSNWRRHAHASFALLTNW
jgi:phospholipase/carboxylesterase